MFREDLIYNSPPAARHCVHLDQPHFCGDNLGVGASKKWNKRIDHELDYFIVSSENNVVFAISEFITYLTIDFAILTDQVSAPWIAAI